jgi:O-antigen/teichoic acid export membrane protein
MWNSERARHHLRRIHQFGITLAFQSGLQGLAVATGLVIIHAISKEEYGLYAIVSSIQGMATALSDSGISSAVTSLLGKTWSDPGATLGVVLTALWERRRLLTGVLPICMVMMLCIAAHKTSATNLVIMETAMVLCVYLDAGSHLYQQVPLYTGRRNSLQTLQMISGGCRITAIILLAVLQEATLLALLSANVLFSLANFFFIRRMVVGEGQTQPVYDPQVRKDIHRIILRLLPNAAFFAFQGQISTYIISLFGKLADIASVAALGRIGLIFGVLLNVIAMLGAPAFSKAADKAAGLRIFWAVVGSVMLFSAAFYGMALLVPGVMLEILGSKYASLKVELQITIISTGLGSVAGTVWTLLSSRGLVGLAWLYILVTITMQVAYPLLGGDLHTVRGVLWFGVVTSGASLLNVGVQAYWLILKPRTLGRNH